MLNSQSVRQHALDFLSKMETEIINELQKKRYCYSSSH